MEAPKISSELFKNRAAFRQAGVDNYPGCYAVFDGSGRCLYVGRSIKLLNRILSHWIDQKDGEGCRWRVAGQTEWYLKKAFAPDGSTIRVWPCENHRETEVLLIHELKPIFNGARYGEMKSPIGFQRVVVELGNGRTVEGVIRGESKDKQCWRIQLDGHSYFTVESYWKGRCRLITDESEYIDEMEEMEEAEVPD